MRKKFYFIAVCAMVISGGAVCYKTIPSSSESNLFIENVEALSASVKVMPVKSLHAILRGLVKVET